MAQEFDAKFMSLFEKSFSQENIKEQLAIFTLPKSWCTNNLVEKQRLLAVSRILDIEFSDEVDVCLSAAKEHVFIIKEFRNEIDKLVDNIVMGEEVGNGITSTTITLLDRFDLPISPETVLQLISCFSNPKTNTLKSVDNKFTKLLQLSSLFNFKRNE